METYRQSLERIYTELAASQLVTEKNANEENINKFINLLNSANPQSEEQHIYFDCINGLYCNNKLVFKRYLEKSNQEFLILLTDGFSIAVNFGINYILFLKFDRETDEFVGLLPTRTNDNRMDGRTNNRNDNRMDNRNNSRSQQRDANRTNDRPQQNNRRQFSKPDSRQESRQEPRQESRQEFRQKPTYKVVYPSKQDASKRDTTELDTSKTYAAVLTKKIPTMVFDDIVDDTTTMTTVDTSILEKTMNETW
jgi:hypothetical protein